MAVSFLHRRQIRAWMPRRNLRSNKTDHGRVLILAGSKSMPGAASLSALGAVRSGAGLVRLMVPDPIHPVVAKRAPLEVMIASYAPSWVSVHREITLFRPDVIAVGPGLGGLLATVRWVRALVRRHEGPVVLDADGLNAFQGKPQWLSVHRGPLVITPHTGELSRLMGFSSTWIERNRGAAATLAARQVRGVCLLKGHHTVISDGRATWVNTTGNPGMATGGMGDVLTGVVASLWAQRLRRGEASGLEAASLAAYAHGLAGDRLKKNGLKIGFLASDVGNELPTVLSHL